MHFKFQTIADTNTQQNNYIEIFYFNNTLNINIIPGKPYQTIQCILNPNYLLTEHKAFHNTFTKELTPLIFNF